MIKIKNQIFNENNIISIKEQNNHIIIDTKLFEISIDNATFNDIEWNYEYIKENIDEYISLSNDYYTLEKRYKELEEENNRIELENEKLKSWVDSLNKDNHKFKDKLKAIEKDYTFENLFNNLSGRCKKLIDYVDDLKDNKQIDTKIAQQIKSKIQCGF